MRQSTVSALALAAGLGLSPSYAIAEGGHHDERPEGEIVVQSHLQEGRNSLLFGLGLRGPVGNFRLSAGMTLDLRDDEARTEEGSRYTDLGWQSQDFHAQPGESFRDTLDNLGLALAVDGGIHLDFEGGPHGGKLHGHFHNIVTARGRNSWRQSFVDETQYSLNVPVLEERVFGETREEKVQDVVSSGGVALSLLGNFPGAYAGIGPALLAHYSVGGEEAELSVGGGFNLAVEHESVGAEISVVIPYNPLEGELGGQFLEGGFYFIPTQDGPRFYASVAVGLEEHDGETEGHVEGAVGVRVPLGRRDEDRSVEYDHEEPEHDDHLYDF